MGLFLIVFIVSIALTYYGFKMGVKETVKTVKSKGLADKDGVPYKYF